MYNVLRPSKRFKSNVYADRLYTAATGQNIDRGDSKIIKTPLSNPNKESKISQYYSSIISKKNVQTDVSSKNLSMTKIPRDGKIIYIRMIW